MERKINVTIYNENFHETSDPEVAKIYPQGIHGAIKSIIEGDADIGTIRVCTLLDHKEILTQEALDDTDVLVWWGHMKHREIDDGVVEIMAKRVLDGMGVIFLHSSHASKLFKKLLGTSGSLRWREAGEKGRLWNLLPNHPITKGIPETFTVPHDETYGELFGIPTPHDLIFITWWQGGEVFRSGCTWIRGEGKLFYLQAGHETFPIYYQNEIRTIICNAIKWACPVTRNILRQRRSNTPALEKYELEDHDFYVFSEHK